MTDEKKPLTRKQQVFVDEYLKCWNAAEAARRAGYSAKTAREQGYDLLKLPHISSQIELRLAEVHMGSEEALKLLADIARGDIGDFMDISTVGFNLDLDEARKAGKTNLIRRVSQKTIINGKTDTETHILDVELYDRLAAIEKILKASGKIKDPPGMEVVFRYANGDIAATLTPTTNKDKE